jgi:SWI/SNF-related matrix-associated actin-dependent regulator 1 of chromatin subfamily A
MLIQFPYNKELIDEIKSIPGRKYRPNDKGWDIPEAFLPTVADMIHPYFPNIADTIRDYFTLTSDGPTLEDMSTAKSETDLAERDSIQILEDVRERLNTPFPLYAYQELAVAFLEARIGMRGALIGDQPGLGKTVEALAFCSLHPQVKPILVVTQASIKRNWYREVEKWLPNSTIQIIDHGKDVIAPESDLVIINYDLIWRANIEKKLLAQEFQIVIFDEVTYLKEPSAKRTKAAKKLAKAAEFTIGLSGTPILNRPIEFYTFLNMISPKQFSSQFQFGMRYCNGYHNGFGYTFKGTSRVDELRQLIHPLMIRRKKDEVLTELPDKSRQNIYIDMPGNYFQNYRAAELDLIKSLKDINPDEEEDEESKEYDNKQMYLLSKLNLLRHLVGLAKADAAEEIIANFVDSGEKLVVFGHHHDVIDTMDTYLTKRKIGHVTVDGRTPSKDRQDAIDKFQENENCMVFLASTAMGMGVTLTAASNALFVERQWTPGMEEQMEDRIHRIGQNRGVFIHYMQVENSIDSKMAKLVEYKREVLAAVLDGERQRDRGTSIIKELLADLSN